jgi:hypothetical protein
MRWRKAAEEWRWKERAEAWDLSELEIRRQQEEQRWRERRIEQKDKEWAAAQGLLEKANQMMQALRVARTVVEDEGRTIIIEPVDWGPSDLARFLDLFSKLGRLSAEMETEKRKEEITGKDGGPIVVEDSLTPEERKRRLAALLASLEKKEG